MKKLKLHFTFLCFTALVFACSDPIQEIDIELDDVKGTSSALNNVIPGGITESIGDCTAFKVYAITSNITSYNRIALITIIKEAKTDPDTGMTLPAEEIEQHSLTIPAGAYVSDTETILQDATEEYDQDFTYKVEIFTDASGNFLSGYTLYELTYAISGNCYTSSGPGGIWSTVLKGCKPEAHGSGTSAEVGAVICDK